jgi:hypothetical protein
MPKENKSRSKETSAAPDATTLLDKPPGKSVEQKEFGGRDGLDPTRFGDWEKNGRCVDF